VDQFPYILFIQPFLIDSATPVFFHPSPVGFLLFPKLWCRWWVGDHPQENLATFGYKSQRKVQKFRNHVIFWQHGGTYSLNMVISKKIPIIWWQWPIFFGRKTFCIYGTGFLSLVTRIWKFAKQPKNAAPAGLYNFLNWFWNLCNFMNLWASWTLSLVIWD